MTDHVVFLALGLGNGAVFAALGLTLVMAFKSSGVVNFATATVALYAAYTFAFLRKGELLNPIPGLPAVVDVGAPWGIVPAMAVSLLVSAVLGVVLYVAVFRPMRTAPILAKAVASIGVMLLLQALIALRVGSEAVVVGPIFATHTLTIGGRVVPADRIWLAVAVVALAVCLAIMFRYTRFGLATEAAAESEKGAVVSGLSPDRIAFANWALSSAFAGFAGIVIAPIIPLNPVAYSMFIVPALAAAMVGNFGAIAATVVAGLAVGMLQSEATNLQATVDWFPASGVAELIPLALVLVFLLVRGQPIPGRGMIVRQDLGRAPRPRRVVAPSLVLIAVALVSLSLTAGSFRVAVIMSMIFAIVGLSQVVITGYAGQVSLAQLTLAGVGAYSLTRFATQWGVPFPLAPILSACAAMVVGVVVGLPALRVRGLPLMVATLALAVFLEAFWFRNPSLNGGLQGAPIDNPTLLGLDLGIGAGQDYPRFAFGLVCLIALTASALGVVVLRRSRLGASMLAVRANERSAAASGINVGVTKLAAFAIASFLAGLGGSLIGYQQTLATAGSYTVFAGIALFAIFYIAGVTSVSGGLVAGLMAPGGVLFVVAERYLHLGDYYALLSGVLLVVTIVMNPDGIVGAVQARLGSRRAATPPPPLEEDATRGDLVTVDGDDGADTPLLDVADVSVRYGSVVAVDQVSLEVRRGEIVGLIGPNGAGKTTVIDAVSGFTRADGEVRLGDDSIASLPPHRRSRRGLGRTFQDTELYDDLSVWENVMIGAVAGRPPGGPAASVHRALALLDITSMADVLVRDLTQGRRQLVSVARILAGGPRIALLDEPAAGLDTDESRWLGERLVRARGQGVSMLLVDHDMDLVLSVCDRVVVLDLGRVIAEGTPAEVAADPRVRQAYLGAPAGAPADTDRPDADAVTVAADPARPREVRS